MLTDGAALLTLCLVFVPIRTVRKALQETC